MPMAYKKESREMSEGKGGFSLLDDAKARRVIEQRIKEGWTIILGDPKVIEFIENSAYPPGTKENELFQMFLAPWLPNLGFFLAKKTEKLANLLGNCPDLDSTICLEILGMVGEKTIMVHQIGAKEGQMENAIEQVIRKVMKPSGFVG